MADQLPPLDPELEFPAGSDEEHLEKKISQLTEEIRLLKAAATPATARLAGLEEELKGARILLAFVTS